MLQGDAMHLRASKYFMQQGILFDRDTPIFSTADAAVNICSIKGVGIDTVNAEMTSLNGDMLSFGAKYPNPRKRELNHAVDLLRTLCSFTDQLKMLQMFHLHVIFL